MRQSERGNALLFALLLIVTIIPVSADIQYSYSGNTFISDYIIDSIIISTDNPITPILELYNNNGFPFAAVNVDSALMTGSLSHIFLSIDENERFRISGIINRGNIKSAMLENIFDFSKQYYSDTLIERGISFIKSRLDISQKVIFTPYITDEGLFIQTDISQERYSYITGLFATSFDADFFGFIDADIYSPQGYGRHYRLYYERDSEHMTEMNAEIQLPYLLKIPMSFSIEGLYTDYDSLTAKAGGHLGAVYYTGILDISAGIGREWVLSAVQDFNEQYTVITTGIQSGIFKKVYAYAEFAHFNGEHSFGKTYMGISDIFTLGNFFIRPGIFGDFTVYGDSIGLSQTNRTGGTESIRGIAENSLIFTNIFYARLETGFMPNRYIRAFILSDMGLFNDDILYSAYENILTYGAGFEISSGNVSTGIYAALPAGSSMNASRLHIMLKYLF